MWLMFDIDSSDDEFEHLCWCFDIWPSVTHEFVLDWKSNCFWTFWMLITPDCGWLITLAIIELVSILVLHDVFIYHLVISWTVWPDKDLSVIETLSLLTLWHEVNVQALHSFHSHHYLSALHTIMMCISLNWKIPSLV